MPRKVTAWCRAWRSWHPRLPGACCDIASMNASTIWPKSITEFPPPHPLLGSPPRLSRANGRDYRQCHPSSRRSSSRTPGLAYTPHNVHSPLPPLRSWRTAFAVLAFGRLAGEKSACLWGGRLLYEFAEKYTPRLLEGATLEFWSPIVLGTAENRVWTGLFLRAESDDDDRRGYRGGADPFRP